MSRRVLKQIEVVTQRRGFATPANPQPIMGNSKKSAMDVAIERLRAAWHNGEVIRAEIGERHVIENGDNQVVRYSPLISFHKCPEGQEFADDKAPWWEHA